MTTRKPPSSTTILERLKGFQQLAVTHAFHRLYEAEDSTRRFLVADEVGLGKTLIARGVIARAIEHLWDHVRRIDVVYVCSNTTIANQNLKRLNIAEDRAQSSADRITMLPINLQELDNSKLNFVAFTPGTSFDLKSRMGQSRERRLLYWMTQAVWEVPGVSAKNFWQATVRKTKRWRRQLDEFLDNNTIASSLQKAFRKALRARNREDRAERRTPLRKRYLRCCAAFARSDSVVSEEMAEERSRLIRIFRTILARICIQALEPDLVILDEFQRFKHLLDGQDEAAQLAEELFSYSDEDSSVRVLLLSATPYKMYTLHHEQAEDDHYADFLRTVDFLDPDPARRERFREDLTAYRRGIYRLAEGSATELAAARTRIEWMLRRVMSRTERTGATGGRDGMLGDAAPWPIHIEAQDVRSYVEIQRVGRELSRPIPVEYWKSAPYLLELMDGYELDSQLVERLDAGLPDPSLARLLATRTHDRLPWEQVRQYGPLRPPNARLRGFLDSYLTDDVMRLLWMPPSLPQTRLEGPFAKAHARGITKRLVFSDLHVIPKAIATLMSYTLERTVVRAIDPDATNESEAYSRRSRDLLRITRDSSGRLTGMPVLALMYPSPTLARLGDPLHLHAHPDQSTPTLGEVRQHIQDRIEAAWRTLDHHPSHEGPPDQAWYWAAPILLDLAHDEATRAWWQRDELSRTWQPRTPNQNDAPESDEDHDGSSWHEHVDQAAELLGSWRPKGPPPTDLTDVLALLALAGPATCALRALARVAGEATYASHEARDNAAAIAFGLRSMFNGVEATAIVRSTQEDGPYWRQVLAYAAGGGLGAVLEEHVHLQRDLQGLFDASPEKFSKEIGETLASALTLPTPTLRGRTIEVDATDQMIHTARQGLRCHMAARFGSRADEDDTTAVRNDRVRSAFNTPFWPFVLASTSIGQEGLDFHAWCHAVVHWNLPSNPVDMEQREGRVHRFKGHAVRKNVAISHGQQALRDSAKAATNTPTDPWQYAFDLAARSTTNDHGGLVPYWVHAVEGGAQIERHVPALPLSRDELRLEALRRSLAVYRMVFGQPRQDDLMKFLLARVPPEVLEERQRELRIDLSPVAADDRG